MPRTFGRNQIHISQVVGWCEADYPLVEVPPRRAVRAMDRRIAALVAERIPDGATIQVGHRRRSPTRILAPLRDHRDLGVHTELISDGVMDLVERGVVTGVRKQLNRTKTVATFALGTQRLYDFLDENTAVELWPVALRQRPPGHRPGAAASCRSTRRIAVDLLGPVRLGDRRRRVLVVERRAGRLRPRRDVLQGRAGLRRAALDRQGRHGVARSWPQLAAGDVVTTHQEHRRQGGHRVRRGRAARPLDPASGPKRSSASPIPTTAMTCAPRAGDLGYL